MKKLIAISFLTIAIQITGFTQTAVDTSALMRDIFPEYSVGDDDRQSIGALKHIFYDSSAKEEFYKANQNIQKLGVTGTAAPFEKRVPFSEWINTYVVVGQYGSDSAQISYSISERSDGVTQEFLVVKQENVRVRTIIVSRLNGSIISIWDSKLN